MNPAGVLSRLAIGTERLKIPLAQRTDVNVKSLCGLLLRLLSRYFLRLYHSPKSLIKLRQE